MIVLAIFLGCAIRQIDFVQAYAQAPIECDMYMELPPGIKTKHGISKDYVLKLLANLYTVKNKLVASGITLSAGLNIEDEGHQADYVGVNIKRNHDGTYEFTQCALINAIIDDVDIGNSYTKQVPAKVSLQLHAFCDSPKYDENLKYCSAVSTLNYLGQTTRPNILYTVHQAAKYSTDPRLEHGEAIVYISNI
ncbi:hypothetical protein ACHAW6_001228 [Cyclotella cf. meneghiniana]